MSGTSIPNFKLVLAAGVGNDVGAVEVIVGAVEVCMGAAAGEGVRDHDLLLLVAAGDVVLIRSDKKMKLIDDVRRQDEGVAGSGSNVADQAASSSPVIFTYNAVPEFPMEYIDLDGHPRPRGSPEDRLPLLQSLS